MGWLLLTLTTWADPPPEPTAPAEPVFVLVTDEEGVWEPEQQARFRPPSSLGDASTLSTDWKELVKTRPFRLLSYGDRVALLRYPQRLLASSWSDQLFSARHVLVLKPASEGRISGRFFDLVTGVERPVLVPVASGKNEETRGQALQEAIEQAEVSKEPVVGHPESGLYHKPDVPHLSPRVQYLDFVSPQRAQMSGLRPCKVCFTGVRRDNLYQDIDHRLGEVVARNIEARYRVAPEGPQVERVRAIGERLLHENRFLDQGYRFVVLDTETVNAFAAPTGPIYITTGMLEILESDDELAGVLGHELSHSERRHARRQYEQAQSAGVLGLLVTVATGIPWARLGSDILATVLVRGYSRGFELEADRDGMMTAYAAGYVPEDFLLVQAKLQELSAQRGGGGPDWLRTHPRGEERTRQLNEILEKTALLRERVRRLEDWDPGMAGFLKGRALFLSDDTSEVADYLARYEKLASRLDRTPPEPIVPEPFWEALEMWIADPAEDTPEGLAAPADPTPSVDPSAPAEPAPSVDSSAPADPAPSEEPEPSPAPAPPEFP